MLLQRSECSVALVRDNEVDNRPFMLIRSACLSSLRSCAIWETHFIPDALSYGGQCGIDGLLEEIVY
jgi:hypothetical protein